VHTAHTRNAFYTVLSLSRIRCFNSREKKIPHRQLLTDIIKMCFTTKTGNHSEYQATNTVDRAVIESTIKRGHRRVRYERAEISAGVVLHIIVREIYRSQTVYFGE